MKTYKQLLLIPVAAALFAPIRVAWADEIPIGDVRVAVQTWVQYVTADARPDGVIETLEPWIVGGEMLAQIAHLQGGGYCLCGADTLALPVYLYVPQGTYDPNSPTNLFVLNEIAGRTAALRKIIKGRVADRALASQLADRSAYWQNLISGDAPAAPPAPAGTPGQMTLPLTCTWDQGQPYNDNCPNLTQFEQTVTGCVATATAQVMYYWKWPTTGEGQSTMDYPIYFRVNWDSEPLATDPVIPATYPWSPDRLRYNASTHRLEVNGYWDQSVLNAAVQIAPSNAAYQTALGALASRMGVLTDTQVANHAATTYDWGHTLDSVSEPTDAASIAIATVMYHAGVACLMHWGILGSSTGDSEKIHALRDNFRYDADITGEASNRDLITQDIQWFRPVTLGGSGPSGGHDWVVYGYNTATDPNRQFRMNFGWSGASNGWYTLDAINTPNGSFNANQYEVRRIAPRGVVRFVDTVAAGDGTPDSPYGSLSQALAGSPNGTTLVFKAGSVNHFDGSPIFIARPLTLKGFEATLQP